MSDEGSSTKRTVMLTIESEDSRPGHTFIRALDPETGEQVDILGITHATVCIDPHKPLTVHLEVIPDKVNIKAILAHVEDAALA